MPIRAVARPIVDLVEPAEAVAALETLTAQVTALLRTVAEPAAPAIGHWTVGEVAAHLSHVAAVDLALARGGGRDAFAAMGLPAPGDVGDVATLNAAALAGDPLRAPSVMADRIEASVALLADVGRHGREGVQWLFDTRLSPAAVCSHYVSELAVHGRDIARASGVDWPLHPEAARVAVEGFYAPIIAAMGGPDAGEGPLLASCEIRVRGGHRFVVARTPGGVAVLASAPRVDLHLSGDPVTLLLVMGGRSGRLGPALRGRLRAWGRHPLRAMRLLESLRSP